MSVVELKKSMFYCVKVWVTVCKPGATGLESTLSTESGDAHFHQYKIPAGDAEDNVFHWMP